MIAHIRKASNPARPRMGEAQQFPRYSPNTACPKGSRKHIRFNHRGFCCGIRSGRLPIVVFRFCPDAFANALFRLYSECPGIKYPSGFSTALPIHTVAHASCALACMTLRIIYAFKSNVLSFHAKEHIRYGIKVGKRPSAGIYDRLSGGERQSLHLPREFKAERVERVRKLFFENPSRRSAPISCPSRTRASPRLPCLPTPHGRTQVRALACMTLRVIYAFNACVLSFRTREHIGYVSEGGKY